MTGPRVVPTRSNIRRSQVMLLLATAATGQVRALLRAGGPRSGGSPALAWDFSLRNGWPMNVHDWGTRFKETYDLGIQRYQQGKTSAKALFTGSEVAFLTTIGCTAQELFDFVEDKVKYGDPSYETALLITAARRDYFWVVQKGKPSGKVVSMDSLPAKTDAVEGIAWLPRLIEKAKIKLRGEMPDDLMYGCGGDRPFARDMNFELADFLRIVWAAGEDDARVVEFVKASAKGGTAAGFQRFGS